MSERDSGQVDAEHAAAAGAGQAGEADLAGTIAELRDQVAQAQDQRLRALADVENIRKRCANQVGRAQTETTARVAAQWLPVVDNLERAVAHSAAEPGAIAEGVRAVLDQALRVLAGLGFPRRDDVGEPFDPARHEAVAARADAAAADGTVLDVTRPGYGEGDHLLRPAQVVVARPD